MIPTYTRDMMGRRLLQRRCSSSTATSSASRRGGSRTVPAAISRVVPAQRTRQVAPHPQKKGLLSQLSRRITGGQQQQQQQPASAGQQQLHWAQQALLSSYSPLVLVSLLWGSYTPTLRYLYSMDDALTPQVLTAHRTVISAAALLLASAGVTLHSKYRQHQETQQQQQQQQQEQQQQGPGWPASFAWPWASAAAAGDKSNKQQQQLSRPSSSAAGASQVLPPPTNDTNSSSTNSSSTTNSSSAADDDGSSTAAAAAVLAAGLELGIWNFLGTSSQAIGLELSTATKAAFLTQTTAVFTPCLAALCGEQVLPGHWLACLAALLGSCCITLDSLIDSSSWQQQLMQQLQPAPAAVTAQVTAAAAAGGGGSSSSRVEDGDGDAPRLGRQVLTALAAPLLTDGSSSSSTGSSSSSSTLEVPFRGLDDLAHGEDTEASSSFGSGDAGAAVTMLPAVTCSPAATPPQGVVHAVACAQIPAASSNSSSSDGPAVSGSSSSSSSVDMKQQLQQAGADAQALPAAATATTEDAAAAAASTSSSSSAGGGELYILLACACYAIATVRMSRLAPGLDPVKLATSKTLTLAAASLCWLLAFGSGAVTTTAAAAAAAGAVSAATAAAPEAAAATVAAPGSLGGAAAAALQAAADAWQLPASFTHGKGMLLLFYSALGPGALATVMQAQGQARVTAAQAQVFYSLTPVWAALLASACLQGEDMGPLAWLGGVVIIAASIGAAFGSSSLDGGSSSEARGSGGGSRGVGGTN